MELSILARAVFPNELPARSHLEYYAERFQTTELNGVFYRTPTSRPFAAGPSRTPDICLCLEGVEVHHHWKLSMTPRETASR